MVVVPKVVMGAAAVVVAEEATIKVAAAMDMAAVVEAEEVVLVAAVGVPTVAEAAIVATAVPPLPIPIRRGKVPTNPAALASFLRKGARFNPIPTAQCPSAFIPSRNSFPVTAF